MATRIRRRDLFSVELRPRSPSCSTAAGAARTPRGSPSRTPSAASENLQAKWEDTQIQWEALKNQRLLFIPLLQSALCSMEGNLARSFAPSTYRVTLQGWDNIWLNLVSGYSHFTIKWGGFMDWFHLWAIPQWRSNAFLRSNWFYQKTKCKMSVEWL